MTEHDEDFGELMRRFSAGSEDAARELVEKHEPFIRRNVRRMLDYRLRSKFDSLDFVQDVLGSVYRRRHRLRYLETREQLLEFVIGMARNKVRQAERRYRTEKRQLGREVSLEDLPRREADLPDREPSQVGMVIAQENWDRTLQGHSERDRRIVQLRSERLTWQAIARKLKISLNHAQRILAALVREAFGK